MKHKPWSPATCTVTEAAAILGISRQAVHNLIRSEQIKVTATEVFPNRYGNGRMLLNRQSVENLAKERAK